MVDAGGGSARIFHEAVTEANLLLVPVAPTKIERRKLVATFDEAERAAARNTHDVTAHVVMVKADDRTSLPRTAKDKLLDPAPGEGIGPHRGCSASAASIRTYVGVRLPGLEACSRQAISGTRDVASTQIHTTSRTTALASSARTCREPQPIAALR
ncbi:hypothetical protein [Streptomyces sp. NPDC006446]|uniref:hypothetical protein n=1 Tax=Streptomyces sp. NPDC006446 TaxID=3154301 RepID=UPI0033B87BC8